jgi:hypothetical protein
LFPLRSQQKRKQVKEDQKAQRQQTCCRLGSVLKLTRMLRTRQKCMIVNHKDIISETVRNNTNK